MAKDQKPKEEAKGVKPEADLNGEVSMGEKPADAKPEVDPAKAAESLKGSIKEQVLQVSPIAESISGKDAGAAQSNRALGMSPAGALLPSAVDDRSRIRDPRTPGRPGSIYDKNSFSSKIDYMNVGCEQAKAEISHAPTLDESPMQGTFSKSIPFQEYSNKRRGEAPQSQLHFRSIDFEHTASEIVYSMGQLIDYEERNQTAATGVVRRIQPDQDYPATMKYLDANKQVVADTCTLANTRGNYLLQGINITFSRDANGREYVSGLSFDQTKIPVVKATRSSARTNHNLEVSSNIEAQRLLKTISSDLIKPNTEKYNDLTVALNNERKPFFNLYGDMEGDTGYLAMMAYRFANMEYASINARLAKSGSNESNEDLVKYFLNNNIDSANALHTNALDALRIYNDVFNWNGNDNTLPMIPWYRFTQPSIRQFSDWSTLLTNKSTPKTLIDKAEKILDSFYVDPKAWNYIKNTQLYSTLDGYNPNTPIVITPGYKVIIREDLNLWANSFNRDNVSSINLSGTGRVFSQAWCQIDRKNTEVNIKHPFVDGLLYFLVKNEDRLLAAFGGVDGIREANGEQAVQGATSGTIHYNFDFTVESFNPVCFLILAALPSMARIRNHNTYYTFDMWKEIGVPTEGHCVTASASLALAAANFGIVDYAHAIEVKQMSDVGRFRYLYPERFNIIDSSNVEANDNNNRQLFTRYIELPWYLAEDTICIDRQAAQNGFFNLDEERIGMNYPVLRRGLTHSEVSFFKKFSPRDTRLILDQIVELPRAHYLGLGSINQIDASDFNPSMKLCIRHDEYTSGRVVLGYSTVNMNQHQMKSPDYHDVTITQGMLLQTPRELGYFAAPLPFMQTIMLVDSVELQQSGNHNLIHFIDNVQHPMNTLVDRIEEIQNAMGFDGFISSGSRVFDWLDLPVGAGIYGESYDFYWNEFDVNTQAGLQLAAGFRQVYDRVYDLFSMNGRNINILHDHDVCLGLGFNYAPFGARNHNQVHDIYFDEAYEYAIPNDFTRSAGGVLPYPDLVTSTATKCINLMLTTTFKPYNYMNGIEVQRAIRYGAAATTDTQPVFSPVAEYQLDMFELAYYFNFCGFDATYYVNDLNARDENYNALNDGYLEDEFIKDSLVLQ